DPCTGEFTWLVNAGRHGRVGGAAGHLDESQGYVLVGICGESYRAHRLAWFYVHGQWPPQEIDHINGNRADNRIANLRLATDAENAWNASRRSDNSTGYKGVSMYKNGKFMAYVHKGRKRHHLGYFDTPEAAHAAYVKAAAELHGEFANTGNSDI